MGLELKKLGAYSERQRNGNTAVLDPERRDQGAAKPSERANGEVYLSATHVEFHSFDASYIELLRRGDGATQDHFVKYFGKLLRIKLRSRKLPVHLIQDLLQETFLRVLVAVRTQEVRQPERLGAYVNSVCNNILLEQYRLHTREQHVDLDEADGPDAAADLEAKVIHDETTRSVHLTLKQLPVLDAKVLDALLHDRDKDELCRELKVTREYLRVLTHRAIKAFKDRHHKRRKRDHGIGQVAE